MESLFPAPFWEVLYGSHFQGNLSLLNETVPHHLLLNASHSAFLPLGLKVTIVGLYLAVCIGGLLGNCLVMYVILRQCPENPLRGVLRETEERRQHLSLLIPSTNSHSGTPR
ncbi:opioid receptor-like 1, isoform CRA_b [Mus musculus]|uniref:Isoform KOR3B of Nociceptin receptor n=1 Tax=Mus musculus TaxID=10090 RepID=P35377-3|nr:kappa3 related opioid receptor isoform B [Mus musculus]EDL07451.1 opioid receptor-like 1, isoform CRA_b [Mus musculus]